MIQSEVREAANELGSEEELMFQDFTEEPLVRFGQYHSTPRGASASSWLKHRRNDQMDNVRGLLRAKA
ncbi:hypothetical protein HY463_00670 [Candidatus Peregrinibacteria bacterium]|nr:hypothetical protein [Candidatus Peregrinibacteria bacterium]